MSEPIVPTQQEILDETMKQVHHETQGTWRHGTDEQYVYYRESDETYWMVCYQVQTNGEWHGLVEGDYTVIQVTPIQTVVTKYVPLEKK